MAGLEGVDAVGLILREDCENTCVGTGRKEGGSTDSNRRERSRKESIYDTYVIAISGFIDSERAPTHPS